MTTPYEQYQINNQPALPEPAENTKKIAFVIDGVVVQTLSTDERLAAVVLSSPTVIDITDIFYQGEVETEEGNHQLVISNDWTYDGTTFHPPL
jgi:hypothetical protein